MRSAPTERANDRPGRRACTHKSTTLIDVRLAPTSGAKATFPGRRFVPVAAIAAIRRTGLMEYFAGSRGSLGLDTRELDYLGPLLGFIGDQPAKIRRRSRQRRAAKVSDPGLHLRVVESRIDLLVELVDDLGRRGLRCAEAEPGARLIARHEFTHG